MVDSGKAFISSTSLLLSSIHVLTKYFNEDELVQGPLKKFSQTFEELNNFFKTLLDQTQMSISTTLQQFVKNDVKRVKETKKLFDKISDELDNALNKHAQLPKTCKQHELEEDRNILTAMQSCFDHISLDYAFQINLLQSRKRIEVLDALSKFMHSHFTYYHQGYDLMNDLERYMKDMSHQLNDLSTQFSCDKKGMEERHTLVQRKDSFEKRCGNLENQESPAGVVIEGYLYKRSSNAFKTWQRRYFTVQNNQLFYQKRQKDEQTVLAEDLRLCIVKTNDEVERRNCFDVVSPTKSWTLQADSDVIRDEWMQTMQASINKAFSVHKEEQESEDESLSSSKRSKSMDSVEKIPPPKSILEAVRSVPGNEVCADCNHNDPKWASINLGVVLCIECSGIHRSLGVHVSKVRSLTLDAWEPEHLKLMSELGNSLINSIYEAKIAGDHKKINHLSNRSDREAWIKSKYIYHRFVSLDSFLRTSDRLNTGIIRNLARMTVYHEQKYSQSMNESAQASLERSDSKVSRILQMTYGLKKPFKGDKKRYSSALEMSSGPHNSLSSDSHEPKSKSNISTFDKKQKSRLRKFSKGRKDDILKAKRHFKKGHKVSEGADAHESYEDSRSSSENVGGREDSGQGPAGPTDEHLAHSSEEPSPQESDPENKVTYEGSEEADDEEESRTWPTKDIPQHSLDSDHEQAGLTVRSRSESTDSVLSDEEVAPSGYLPSNGGNEQTFKDDLEKAISVLKVLHPNRLLYKAAEWNSIPLMVAAFAEGAKANWVNEDDDSKTVLHQSVLGGSLTASEYLLQNGAKINLRDCRGRSALHHAALLGQTGQTCLFLKRGANQHAVDENGEDPLTIALKQTNADIVTLLRIARLNDEMRESEEFSYGSPSDVTFTDVFRDFSNMASMNPDRLKRDFGGAKQTSENPDRQTDI
ncbi:arf-GAP with coiled-coil, ANK repeat and PH domain-containing protein 2 isoform X2 [Nematostella vectensis]|nr:arf-GAP with coiled-coil, ANK repeat and PH domain-containing protein 2 isoform X2 [Nematostella vectensis]